MGKTKFKVGDVVRLTGKDWKRHRVFGKIVTVDRVYDDWGMYFCSDGRKKYCVYKAGRGKNDFSATLVEEAARVEPKKKLREYTDLKDGDVVVIAGVETRVYMYARGNMRLAQARGGSVEADGPLMDMLVDEVRRAKRTVKEFVVREDANGLIVINGVRFRVAEEREVEE